MTLLQFNLFVLALKKTIININFDRLAFCRIITPVINGICYSLISIRAKYPIPYKYSIKNKYNENEN